MKTWSVRQPASHGPLDGADEPPGGAHVGADEGAGAGGALRHPSLERERPFFRKRLVRFLERATCLA